MRIPALLSNIPSKALIAGLLLLALLFGSADRHAAEVAAAASAPPRRNGAKNVKKIRPARNELLGPPVIYHERTSDPERPQPLRQPASGVRSLPQKSQKPDSQGILPRNRAFWASAIDRPHSALEVLAGRPIRQLGWPADVWQNIAAPDPMLVAVALHQIQQRPSASAGTGWARRDSARARPPAITLRPGCVEAQPGGGFIIGGEDRAGADALAPARPG